MKKYRENWNEDIVKYIFTTYEHSRTSGNCSKCPFYIDLDVKYKPINDTLYLEYSDDKKIHFDDFEKLCKHVCIFYY